MSFSRTDSRNYRNKTKITTLAAIFLILISQAAAQDFQPDRASIGLFARGLVSEVHTGDEFTMDLGPITIRLHLRNIKAPRLDGPFGPEAKRTLEAMILNRRVSILYDKPDPDNPQEVPEAEIFAGGTNIIHRMLQHGLAETVGADRTDPTLAQIQNAAAADGIGIWIHADVATPRGSEIYAGHLR